jgi:hypothetical protein
MKGRTPKEIRRPKVEGQSSGGARLSQIAAVGTRAGRTSFLFGFRISAFLRDSDFGFRIFTSALCLLAPALSFCAATNTPTSDEIPSLRPPHAELPPSFWEQYGPWTILLGVLVLALVCAAIWFLTRPKPPVVVPPEVAARNALEPLRQVPEDGLLLSRVSQVLRHYAATAFGLPPGELTTAEFCRAIAGHEQVGPELASALSDFLRQCDQRKFSPPPPAPPLSAVAHALKLIDQAQARLAALAQPVAQPSMSPNATRSGTGIEK